jgi:hypothetical protein
MRYEKISINKFRQVKYKKYDLLSTVDFSIKMERILIKQILPFLFDEYYKERFIEIEVIK